jgi:hypothetical protein
VVNQKYKKAFEEGVKDFAERNPKLRVMTIHQPIYVSQKGQLASFRARPKAVLHLMAINGDIVSAFTFKNSKKFIMARPS